MLESGIDPRLVLTILGIVFSVAGAAAIARSQIARHQEQLSEIHATLRENDGRVDRLVTSVESQTQRLDVLSGMMSPSEQKFVHREMGSILQKLSYIEREVTKLQSLHNGKHVRVDE